MRMVHITATDDDGIILDTVSIEIDNPEAYKIAVRVLPPECDDSYTLTIGKE